MVGVSRGHASHQLARAAARRVATAGETKQSMRKVDKTSLMVKLARAVHEECKTLVRSGFDEPQGFRSKLDAT